MVSADAGAREAGEGRGVATTVLVLWFVNTLSCGPPGDDSSRAMVKIRYRIFEPEHLGTLLT